jgi:hypothetical protein
MVSNGEPVVRFVRFTPLVARADPSLVVDFASAWARL